MRLFAALAAMLLLAVPAQARYSHYYRSADGSIVHGPTRGNHSYGLVTAHCRDGSRSFSHQHRGTCSHHGGVSDWGG